MKQAKTKLEKEVKHWLNEQGKEYSDKEKGAYDDLMNGGCSSGMVSDLIYYSDTIKFYEKHRKEINKLLVNALDGIGGSPVVIFGDKWGSEDPLALDVSNQNLLAWFGFEETARNLMED